MVTPERSINDFHLKYMNEILIPEIVGTFQNETLKNAEIEYSGGLDGFMSALYNIQLETTLNKEPKNITMRSIIVKFMKGDVAFRESSKSYIQFANEIFIYETVLPAYDELLKQAKVTDVSVEDWIAHCYLAKFGYVEGLSSTPSARESVLALENLKPRGYTLGPRLYLNRNQLLAMTKPLAQYHAMSYALRIHDHTKFEKLRKQIIPLPFININDPEDDKKNFYSVLYRVAFERFYEYFDRAIEQDTFDKETPDNLKLIKNVQHLREKYFNHPTKLMEHLHTSVEDSEEDKKYGVILHGDYNRNNVLFRFNEGQGDVNVEDVKLIDFQELRYGSPALDLSFYMFFNSSEDIRSEVWLDILKSYHEQMYSTLSKTLYGVKNGNTDEVKEVLEQYSFEKFNAHFSRFAFYGVMICLHFLPWCSCSEEECSQLSHYFETDMCGEEFYKISMTAGGDESNRRILEVVKHASKMGYMDSL